MERDLEKVRRITRDLFFWQGLRFVPIGPVLVVAALTWTTA
jgi:hypothetical protein